MKISLIYPLLSKTRSLIDENKQYWPPLGLAYIAAVLEKSGHPVQILDRDYILRKNNYNFERADDITLSSIKEFGTQIVGFSATTPNISDVDNISRKLKKINRILTVLGGPHPTGEPVETLKMCSGIDMVVRGEGEMTMLDLANGVDFADILGLTYKNEKGEILSNSDRPLLKNLDSLPLPARYMLDMDFYTRPSRFIGRNLSLRTTHIFTSRGCPFNCYYCAGPLMGQRKVRYHSPQRTTEEIEQLITKYDIEAVYFADDMFLSNKERAIEIIELFINRGINKKIVWMAQLNPNATDADFLSLMKKGGCVHVEYGFESGSQRILDLMNKCANIERNIRVAEITRKKGLRFQGNFIIGYPGETEDDFFKTIAFIKKTRPNNTSLNIFMPLPGTYIYNKLKQEGRLVHNWDDVGNPETPFVNYADMPKSRFVELYFKAKIRVVLPLNLFYFLKDNIWHPLRLLYVVSTQFRSVISRACKAIIQLRKICLVSKRERRRILFIVYHSISYPIMESQGLSYMKILSKKGIDYSLLTFETKETLKNLKDNPLDVNKDFIWRRLFYHRRPRFLAKILDTIMGILVILYTIIRDKIKIVHVRGLIPAAMAFLPAKLLGVKFFFDTRGLLAEKYVGGGLLKKGSFTYWLMKYAEEFLVKNSDIFCVETTRHANIIKREHPQLIHKIEVIPCCVDTDKFNYAHFFSAGYQIVKENRFNIIYLGKLGTWYLIDEMLDFFRVLLREVNNSCFTFITEDKPEPLYLSASKKGIPESQVVIKSVAREEIPRLLSFGNAGIFFINPYKRYNSFPIKYGEYLASGLPVVINCGIGDTDVITESEKVGVVIRDFSDDDYRKAVKELIDLTTDKESLRQRCAQVARKYLSLEDGANKYLNIYQRLFL